MKWLHVGLLCISVGGASAAACGSDDGRDDGGAAGEGGGAAGEGGGTAGAGGAGEVTAQGGSQSHVEPGGAGGNAQAGAAGETSRAGAGGSPEDTAGGSAGQTGEAQAGAGGAASETVVDISFDDSEGLPASLEPGSSLPTPAQDFAPLGAEGNRFGTTFLRGPTGSVVTLTLIDLPPHTTLSLGLLFAAIDSLDGSGTFPAGDYFKITLDDVTVFRESFANALDDQIQSYDPPAEAVLARHVDLGFGGPGGYFRDSAYDFGRDPAFQDIPHSASSAVLVFTLEGEGVQTLEDESWAIDNVRVTVR